MCTTGLLALGFKKKKKNNHICSYTPVPSLSLSISISLSLCTHVSRSALTMTDTPRCIHVQIRVDLQSKTSYIPSGCTRVCRFHLHSTSYTYLVAVEWQQQHTVWFSHVLAVQRKHVLWKITRSSNTSLASLRTFSRRQSSSSAICPVLRYLWRLQY